MKNNSPRTLTTVEEKSKRLDFINGEFMSKYLELVWYARSNPEKLIEEERFDIVSDVLKSLQKIADKYPRETKEFDEDETSWQHGFNSGILAYSRFIADYVEDTLCELDEEDQIDEREIVEHNGVKYIVMDGRSDAFENFPFLDT